MDNPVALIDGEETRLIQARELSERCASVAARAYGICKAAFLDRFVLQGVTGQRAQFEDRHKQVRIVVDPVAGSASPDTLTLMAMLGPDDEAWLDEASFARALARREEESQRRRRRESLLAATVAGRALVTALAGGAWRGFAEVWAWRERESLAAGLLAAVARRCTPAEWQLLRGLVGSAATGQADPLVEFVLDLAGALRDLSRLAGEPGLGRVLELVHLEEARGLATRERAELRVRASRSLRLGHAVANGSLHRCVRAGCAAVPAPALAPSP